MKKLAKRVVSMLLSVSLMATMFMGNGMPASAETSMTTNTTTQATKTASQKYVEAMAPGWNLGNTLESCDTNRQGMGLSNVNRETLWGQPTVNQTVFKNVKKAGYKSVRIPVTYEGSVMDQSKNYKIDDKWLARVKKVVQMALDEDLYVVINVHNESWMWLNSWDGNVKSKEYVKYTALWKQIAAAFKGYGQKLSFETINEPTFTSNAQDKLNKINKAAYDIVRKSGGNNATRMVILPTLETNHEQCKPLYDQITTKYLVNGKQDPNVIATVHYYGEWIYSANLGKTSFDEKLWDDASYKNGYTQRVAIDKAFNTMYDQFTKNGIGVLVGEYGLLGYDSGMECNQPGEELKYYEYVNYVAKKLGITLMFWDNGSGMDRKANCSKWVKPIVGEWITASMKGRSSYATGLDTIYIKQKNNTYTYTDIKIPLTLNGNKFTKIMNGNTTLTLGKDYTYDEKSATVTLKKDYIKRVVTAKKTTLGTVATLKFKFSSGATWYEYIRTCKSAVYTNATKGNSETPVKLSINFNGNKVRRVTATCNGKRIGPNNWAEYLQYSETYLPDYSKNLLNIKKSFFADSSVPTNGRIKLRIEMYSGDVVNYEFDKTATAVKSVLPKVTFTKSVSELKKGKTATFKAKSSSTNGTIRYTSSNSKILEVNATTGVAKAKKAGTAKITATFTGETVKSSKTVTVKVKVPTTSVKIKTTSSNKSTIYMKKGWTYTIGKEVKPADSTDKVTFSSSNKKIATVSSKGKITAKKTGTVTITLKSGSKKAKVKVKVVARKSATKKLTTKKKTVSLKVGKSTSIVAKVTPTNTTDYLVYSSTKKSVATVDKYGIVKAKKKGTAYIKVKSGKKTVTVKVTVK